MYFAKWFAFWVLIWILPPVMALASIWFIGISESWIFNGATLRQVADGSIIGDSNGVFGLSDVIIDMLFTGVVGNINAESNESKTLLDEVDI